VTLRFSLATEADTAAFGAALARIARPGDVIALEGDLGAGKSVLARGFIRALAGADVEAPSPTFTLVQTYDTDSGTVWHFDLYRLEDPEEVWELGIEEAFEDGISLFEWPSRAGSILPRDRLTVTLAIGEGEVRTATLEPGGDWQGRLKDWTPA
jgi:tRNA threonylcarbamoyladenosine biosynthesis protein TsaE